MSAQAAVAAGNAGTAGAAVAVLRAGGNAYDAVVAAGLAAAVCEPGLSSLGGGGFLLARTAQGEEVLVDFFVDAPGRERRAGAPRPALTPVTVRFAGADQVFHAGWGSVGVPGCLDGYLHVHNRLGRLPVGDVVAPALRLAREGTPLDATQAAVVTLLRDILLLEPDGAAVFAPGGRLLRAGDLLRNAPLAELLEHVAAGRVTGVADPRVGAPLVAAMRAAGGDVSESDLTEYRVVEREPLRVRYRGAVVATNPPPSFGGSMVAAALQSLDAVDGSMDAFGALGSALVAMSERHVAAPQAVRGTTHVSVLDGDGNVAAMTTSNGSCSGVFVPGTGIQLNNVMGEVDLHPRGFGAATPGERVSSMMAPTLATTADGGLVALGSGGSERIRSALTCVLTGLLDRGLNLPEAVRAPRLHWDRRLLQVEPGLPPDVLGRLGERWPVRVWPGRDLYFGGAHGVARGADGTVSAAGDGRRGGTAVVLTLP